MKQKSTPGKTGEELNMETLLHVEYFDTDASSYKHRLKLPLKTAGSFVPAEGDVLRVQHADGTTRLSLC